MLVAVGGRLIPTPKPPPRITFDGPIVLLDTLMLTAGVFEPFRSWLPLASTPIEFPDTVFPVATP